MEETLLKGYDLSFQSIPAAGLHGVGLRALPGNLGQLYRGWRKAGNILARFKPDVLFFTGGYLGVPVALAGRRIPSVVFVPDIEPGLALKTILRFAEKIALSCQDSLKYVSGENASVSGYPIRKEMRQWDRVKGRAHFDIPEQETVLLVFGGSKGARSINQALMACLPALLQDMHVIHISGKDNWETISQAAAGLGDRLARRYHPFPFLHEDMGAAFASADLAVCRSGASTLGELPFFGLPAILVPYPYAWRYQQQNAAYLARCGGALILEDALLESHLENQVRDLINDKERLGKMRSAMHSIATPNAAEEIGQMLVSIGGRGGVQW